MLFDLANRGEMDVDCWHQFSQERLPASAFECAGVYAGCREAPLEMQVYTTRLQDQPAKLPIIAWILLLLAL